MCVVCVRRVQYVFVCGVWCVFVVCVLDVCGMCLCVVYVVCVRCVRYVFVCGV